MHESSVEDLIKRGNYLFEKKRPMDRLWQEIADNFYPERGQFTYSRTLGEDYADNLMSSYPLIVRRDLGNSFASMLRRDKWFKIRAKDEEREGYEELAWLEWATNFQYRAMYDRHTNFVRATKEGDHDFAAFGQCVIRVEFNRRTLTLLYRCYHLKDCAWVDGEDGKIKEIHVDWRPTASELIRYFKGTVHPQVEEIARKDPHREVKCRIITYQYEEDTRFPFEQVIVDTERKHELSRTPLRFMDWVVPRWQTVSGSQYAYSPATVVALPDARLLQAMTLTQLEAGEIAVRPPMIATDEVIRSDVNLVAGGITWIDREYDERLGDALRPLTIDKSGLPMGFEFQERIMSRLFEAFYLNKLNLPKAETTGEMTAYEVSERIKQYIREALPLFEPMEYEYNAAICETTFNQLLVNGAFQNIPEGLRGADVEFRFESPLSQAIEREQVGQAREAIDIGAMHAQLDPNVLANVDFGQMLRDAIVATGAPVKWLRSEEEVDQIIADHLAEQQQQQQIDQGEQLANIENRLAQSGPSDEAA